MNIQELRKKMMFNKKNNPEIAAVYQVILGTALLIAKEDGNRVAEDEDIVIAAKRELKMANQSKDLGAPYNPFVFEICEEFLPKKLNEEETTIAVQKIIHTFENPTSKTMGDIMKKITLEYGEKIDRGIASKIVKSLLV
jgi:uncharacterized protein YqeY